MVPPAPPWFSMMICWPISFDTWAAMSRAMPSVGPPAVNGTTQVTVLAGQLCASDHGVVTISAAAAAARRREQFRVLDMIRFLGEWVQRDRSGRGLGQRDAL